MNLHRKDLPDEKEIFRRFTEGDRQAFKQLYEHYTSPLFTLIQGMVKIPDLTDEIVQEVWVNFWNNREKLSGVENPGAYLHRSVVNRAFNHLKKISRDKHAMERIRSFSTELHDEVQEMVNFKDSEKLIQEAVNELPAQRKKIWDLSRNQHKSHAEIAELLGITISTVNNQIGFASSHIRKYLETHGTLVALAALVAFLQD